MKGIIVNDLVPKQEWLDLTDEERDKLKSILEDDCISQTDTYYQLVMFQELFEVDI